MAMANVAVTLSQCGLNVLIIDWDLEAPGLENFFLNEEFFRLDADFNKETILTRHGLMDLILDYKEKMTVDINWDECEELPFEKPGDVAVSIPFKGSVKGQLYLLTAGKRDGENLKTYANTVLNFDWRDFYDNWLGGQYFEWLRQQFETIADVILIDSRTGVTEMGTVCTYQLADAVILLCSANQQNINGTLTMIRNMNRIQVREVRGRELDVFVVPARVESGEESLVRKFQEEFTNTFYDYLPIRVQRYIARNNYFQKLCLYSSTPFAYQERLAVLEKDMSVIRLDAIYTFLTFVISRLAPKDSPIWSAIEEKENMVGNNVIINAELNGSIVSTGEANVTDPVIQGNVEPADFVGRDKIIHYYVNQYDDTLPQKEQEKFARQIKDYLSWVQDSYGRIVLRGIQRGGVIELALDDVYIPLTMDLERGRNFVDRYGELADEMPLTGDRIWGMDSILSHGTHLVLTGAPGCGKTTVLMYIAYIMAKAILSGDTGVVEQELGLKMENTDQLPLPLFMPLGRYAEYRRALPKDTSAERKTLAACITDYLNSSAAGFGLGNLFERLLMAGRSMIVLLDGLDTIPDEAERVMTRSAIEKLAAGRREGLHIIATCRTMAFEGQTTLAGFQEFRVQPIEKHAVERMIRNAYRCIFPQDIMRAEERTKNLLIGIEQIETQRRIRFKSVEPLINSPLMVRILLIVHLNDRRLPEQRAALYDRVVEYMVQAAHNPDVEEAQRLGALVGGNWRDNIEMAQYLAFQMQQGGERGRDVSETDLRRLLGQRERYTPWVDSLVEVTRTRGTLLEEHGGQYRFFHLSFQEFLAARYLASEVLAKEGLEGVVKFFEAGAAQESWWREVVLLVVGYLAEKNGVDAAAGMLLRMVGLDEKVAERNLSAEMQTAMAGLAATSLLDWSDAPQSLRERVVERVVGIFQAGKSSPKDRCAAWDALGRLGDPRFDPNRWYLPAEPNFGFLEIPGGKFLMGSDKSRDPQVDNDELPQHEIKVEMFWMAKYPITVAQYFAFVEDGGYQRTEFWAEAVGAKHWQDGKVKEENGNWRDAPAKYSDVFHLPNHPIVGVTWYEAQAYCRWLTEKLRSLNLLFPILGTGENWVVSLPSEAQWEKTARGPIPPFGEKGYRLYPYGDAFDPDKGNVSSTGIGLTSSVGAFPAGASPYGILDMSGNIFEWCRTKKNSYPYRADDGREQLDQSNEKRCLRGGAFDLGADMARISSRNGNHPSFAGNNIGFRIVLTQFTA